MVIHMLGLDQSPSVVEVFAIYLYSVIHDIDFKGLNLVT